MAGDAEHKYSVIMTRTSNRGEFSESPDNILDVQGTLLRRIEYLDGRPFDLFDLETYFFGQDHWVISPKLALYYGLRFDRQGITETFRLAPRAGLAWTPFDDQKTVVRAGYGIFYDRVPLNVYRSEERRVGKACR